MLKECKRCGSTKFCLELDALSNEYLVICSNCDCQTGMQAMESKKSESAFIDCSVPSPPFDHCLIE